MLYPGTQASGSCIVFPQSLIFTCASTIAVLGEEKTESGAQL